MIGLVNDLQNPSWDPKEGGVHRMIATITANFQYLRALEWAKSQIFISDGFQPMISG
jgi:hypothetical protein